ncbi:diacylglycerol kinase family protein [Subtercola boreus]|uniref:Diacylglycerol kinase n=1 Tax=Subtercola boreus TaxID=120213 RepID=A0A3E0WDL4_9MICO|nr:diacylglycerol kinase family protein [Subtercola boreus]RFA22718.1 diacylglycerol kinase [Subtercola boreus]RFA23073.1 diacylglycerol kinase [Subtercola boreus]RFA28826.1 diacylglycerol kinase [Subtercola boreus]
MPASPPLRLVVAINPTASFGSTSGAGARVVERLRFDGHAVTELRATDFRALAAAARAAVADHPDALVVVGGDGMVSLGVNIVGGTSVPLGIVPTGTGNDSARGLGIPFEFDASMAALRSAFERGPRTIDLGYLTHAGGEMWFASALSAGFDARVNERANHMKRPRGASRYTIALLVELLRLRPRRYTLEVDGVRRTVDSVLLAVANNSSIGGGMMIAPDARLDDGLLDLFIVDPISRVRFLRLFPKVFKGTHAGLPIVSLSRVREVTVAVNSGDIVAYADGERVGPLPVTVSVRAGALRVLA